MGGGARGAASKMDATGRLTYRLPNRDKTPTAPHPPPRRSPRMKHGQSRFPRPVYGAHLLCLIGPQIYTQNCEFSLTHHLILCFIGRDKWKDGQGLPGDHFNFRKHRSGSGKPTQVAPDLDQVSRALRQQAGLILCMCSEPP